MIRPTGVAEIDDNLRALRKGLFALLGTQDRPIARRNARKRVLAQMRKLRAAVDELFPAIVVNKVRAPKAPVGVRVKRLERAGWVLTNSMNTWAGLVPIKRVGTWTLIPLWARAIGATNRTRLQAARKSPTIRKAALAAFALSHGKSQNGAV